MDLHFDIGPEEFQERKRRRIAKMNSEVPPPPKAAPTSAPGVHEIATFLPGRLEFEHELDNEAEDLVKDLEFGIVLEYGGDQIIEDEADLDVKARVRWEEERAATSQGMPIPGGKGPMSNGLNGHHINGDVKREIQPKPEDVTMTNDSADDEATDEPMQPPPLETKDSFTFKLTLLEMYFQRIEKRLENKSFMFDRGLLEYKKVNALPHLQTFSQMINVDASC